ncbi:MAG: glycogen debranching protein GlgX [Gammaproteobacteria bacterium]
MHDQVTQGQPLPLGTRLDDKGCNFALFSRHATAVTLLLFDPVEAPLATTRIDLDPNLHRTGDIWHVHVAGVRPGTGYAYRVDGPCAPAAGMRFDPRRVLVDPCAQSLSGVPGWDFAAARPACDEAAAQEGMPAPGARGVVVDTAFDWHDDRPPRHPWSRTVIYETHVRGLTRHDSARAAHPGTYRGVIEKIPYLQALGITAIELMPVQSFNPNELLQRDPQTGERLRNYWGYSPVGFFAPHTGYASDPTPGAELNEFKTMVRALHAAGIEVILDVVFNHSAEGDETGPTLGLRGLDNGIYYLLDPDDRSRYLNFSGCGNTLNCNHPVVREFILDCLRYWVTEMHVDGFRFDLASVLGRDSGGNILPNPPLLEHIAQDPILRGVKLIAEAWDAGGAYQVGSFPGHRWSEWNGRYRDEVRRFWRGDAGLLGVFASRLAGSSDIYQQNGKTTINSINFVTAHDGFTLNDLVSYAEKHNEANGEADTDGTAQNYSANWGVEGPTQDPAVESLRERQIRNFIATLMLSRGVPMLLGGDEFRRSQRGNNNAYCQDNDISWYDWSLTERHTELVRFTRLMIALRSRLPTLSDEDFYNPEELTWLAPQDGTLNWTEGASALGAHIHVRDHIEICALFNATDAEVLFSLPSDVTHWYRYVDTASMSPHDIELDQTRPPCTSATINVTPASLQIFTTSPSLPIR